MRSLLWTTLLAALVGCTTTITSDDSGDDGDRGGSGSTEPGGADGGGVAFEDEGEDVGPWRVRVERLVDAEALELEADLPAGAIVHAARIEDGVDHAALTYFDAGGGGFSQGFWPASTVKVIAAASAMSFVESLGFTADVSVSFSGVGNLGSLGEIISSALIVSDNLAYVRTLQIAGVDYTNDEVLTPANGFDDSVIVTSYVQGVSARTTPPMNLSEGAIGEQIAARDIQSDFGCERNCTNLYELSDALRRIVLHDELPAAHRLPLTSEGAAVVRSALCEAPSFMRSGADSVLSVASICNKPGWVPDNEYLDHGIITAENGERYLLAISVPWPAACASDSACRALVGDITAAVLPVLQAADGVPIQPDGGIEMPVMADGAALRVDAPGADRLQVWVDREPIEPAAGDGSFEVSLPSVSAESVVTIRAYDGDELIGHRMLRLSE